MIKDIIKKVFKEYWIIIVTVFLVSITGGVSYATFVYNDSSDRVSEMYVSKLDYELTFSGEMLSSYQCYTDYCTVVASGNVFNVTIKSNEDIPTRFKLFYDGNVSLIGFGSGELDSGESVTITMRSTQLSNTSINFKIMGGYLNNSFDEIVLDDENYREINNSVSYPTLFEAMERDNEIFADNVNSTYVNNSTPGINFRNTSSDINGKGLYYTSENTEDFDGDGNSERVYYYRGDINNNYVAFAGYCWKIVRTNEDGSIKLRYNGVYNNDSKCATTSSIGSSPYNYTYGDNAYVGYMMGIDNQCLDVACAGTQHSTSYENAHANIYDSTIKKFIDTWYENNILTQGISVTSKIANAIYCNERYIDEDDQYEQSDYWGSGIQTTYYNNYSRIYSSPKYKCEQKNDQFTLRVNYGGVEGYGNNALKYPVALLTQDELIYAGNKTNSSTNFLTDATWYWLMGANMFSGERAIVNRIGIGVIGHDDVYLNYSVFPAISLKSDVLVNDGSGLSDDPYIIE